jgi:hypothetical protein
MEYKFNLHRSLTNIRLSFEASTLINTGNYENVRRSVTIEGDVTEYAGDGVETREKTVREAFNAMHDAAVSMLSATIAEAVPPDHELASPARKAEYKERIDRERKEEKERREKATAARRARAEAEKEYREMTDACDDCKARYSRNERDPETGARMSYCEKHMEGWKILVAANKVDNDDW